MNKMEHFDTIIIGSGQAGTPLARKMASAGRKTLLVEKYQVGGCCVNYGCTPTKALISSARTAYQAAHSAAWGIHTSEVQVDLAAVMSRKDSIVAQSRSGVEKGIRKTEGLTLLYGEAAFLDRRTIRVITTDGEEKQFTAPVICVNTGGEPRIPDLEGLAEVPYLSSTTLLEISELPQHLLILGGSYLGLEFAQMFRRFGSRVTVLERGSHLLSKEDEDMADAVAEVLREEGIEIITDAGVTRVSGTNPITVETAKGTIRGSHLLLAAGRIPATRALDAGKAGIQLSPEGFIPVNEKLETSVEGIYAMGDVNGGPAFTHIAYHDHLIIAANLLDGKDLSNKGRQLPYCMFTDPEFARIGMTEKEARAKGRNILIATLPMAHTARGIETGNTRGLMKAVVDKASRQILGATFFGAEAGEVMSTLQIAMYAGLTADDLSGHIFAHPLFAESLNNLFMSLT